MENKKYKNTELSSSFQLNETELSSNFQLNETLNVKGRAMFQFNNDEPQLLAELYNVDSLKIELNIPPKNENGSLYDANYGKIVFYDNKNKNSFSLFVERVDDKT